MGYTKFGKIIRKEMIDHDENLLSIAKLFGVSSSFVSAVLIGNKSAPYNWLKTLSEHYDLEDSEYDELYNAYCEDKKNIKIDVEDVPLNQKKLALQFQRRLPELNDDEIHSIFDILKED